MHQPHIHKRVICATAAALLTGVTFSLFVSAEPQNYQNRIAPRTRVATAQVIVSEAAPSYLASKAAASLAG
jgi:hypothetical protein